MIYQQISWCSCNRCCVAQIHWLQADKKRVIFAGDYAESLLSNRLTSKRIKGYVALGDMVDLDGHILKCSKGKGTRTVGLECKNPLKS
jgi:hypothetical protein